jgi:hypothetical protein
MAGVFSCQQPKMTKATFWPNAAENNEARHHNARKPGRFRWRAISRGFSLCELPQASSGHKPSFAVFSEHPQRHQLYLDWHAPARHAFHAS